MVSDGSRVVRMVMSQGVHGGQCRHEWVLESDSSGRVGWFVCSQCGERCISCNTCREQPGRPTGSDLPICRRCHNALGALLGEAEAAVDAWSDVALELSGLRAMSFNLTSSASGADPGRLPYGLDPHVEDWTTVKRDVDADGHIVVRPRTVPGALDQLSDVAAAWEESGAVGCTSWRALRRHLVWAAGWLGVEQWDEDRRTIRRACGVVRQIAGYGAAAVGVKCLDCGGPLVRPLTDEGLDDVVRCGKCRREYTPGAYRLAILAKIEQAHELRPDALVTVAVAKRVFPRARRNTLDVWAWRATRGKPSPLTVVGHDKSGAPLFRVGQIGAALADESCADGESDPGISGV